VVQSPFDEFVGFCIRHGNLLKREWKSHPIFNMLGSVSSESCSVACPSPLGLGEEPTSLSNQ
jgi:hypothetical protein